MAEAAQQQVDQVAVLGDPPVDLGEVGDRAAALVERRIGAERLVEAKVVEAGDLDRVADVAFGRGCGHPGRGGGGRHVGPVDEAGGGGRRGDGGCRHGLGRPPGEDAGEDRADAGHTHAHRGRLSRRPPRAQSTLPRIVAVGPHGAYLAPRRLSREDPAMQAGGFFLTVALLAGAVIGVRYGEGSLGIVVGLAVGLVAVGVFALVERRRR